MTANRTFGLIILVLGSCLSWYILTGALNSAPLIMAFGGAGGIGAVLLGLWYLLGKF